MLLQNLLSLSAPRLCVCDIHSAGKSTLAIITLSPWKWFSDWQDKRHKKRGEDYESLKQMIADRMLQQVYKYYPQIEGRVGVILTL